MFLENAKRVALEDLKPGTLQVSGDRRYARLVGIGFAVAKGWATYEGNGEFRITPDGLAALNSINNPE